MVELLHFLTNLTLTESIAGQRASFWLPCFPLDGNQVCKPIPLRFKK